MRLTTRPKRGQSYQDFKDQWARALGGSEEITSASALTATKHAIGTGRLAPEHRESFRQAEYAVYSYATPIAWRTADGWIMPVDKYSLTTSHHQTHILVTLENYLNEEVTRP